MLKVEEPVRVAVIFGPGRTIRPVWFDWRHRKHEVRQVTYRWREREGAAAVLHFTVTVEGEGTLYELAYDTAGQLWTLAALEAG